MGNTKILVTGATGSTGTPTVEMLLQKEFDVRALVHTKIQDQPAFENSVLKLS